jgi:hypothetical protein
MKSKPQLGMAVVAVIVSTGAQAEPVRWAGPPNLLPPTAEMSCPVVWRSDRMRHKSPVATTNDQSSGNRVAPAQTRYLLPDGGIVAWSSLAGP